METIKVICFIIATIALIAVGIIYYWDTREEKMEENLNICIEGCELTLLSCLSDTTEQFCRFEDVSHWIRGGECKAECEEEYGGN